MVLPELKGHAAPSRQDELARLEMEWEAKAGEKILSFTFFITFQRWIHLSD